MFYSSKQAGFLSSNFSPKIGRMAIEIILTLRNLKISECGARLLRRPIPLEQKENSAE
jgi:hypothetical protein